MAEDSQKPGGRRWGRLVLSLSLALNLLVAGLVVGAVLSHANGVRHAVPGAHSRISDYGPYTRALSDTDRRELRARMRTQSDRLRDNRQAVREGFTRLLSALRSETLDPEQVKQILEEQHARVDDQGRFIRGLLVQQIAEMTPGERAAFADRLERMMHRYRRGPVRSD
ncbi:putative membrane protein [Rhodovulum imhoffii]|uniref:Putative membrane protein n=1 Tax=Rhodovulum imhoffii TaxID=365340 RepID=A0A2T5BQX5_9RHOB|nr:periplasmic heavy metal sensor [Rhodovulum imhoffii]PTN01643.1 putative membrane protein [Rhodovulum imhoffii]